MGGKKMRKKKNERKTTFSVVWMKGENMVEKKINCGFHQIVFFINLRRKQAELRWWL